MKRLELSVASPEAVLNEPVVLHIRFVNDGVPIAFPLESSALDLTTFLVFDSQGRPVARVDGYTREERLGLNPAPAPVESLKTAGLPAGADVEWSEDLLGYMDLPGPGEFRVSVRFRYPPASIDLESGQVAFRVRPLQCRWFDVLEDCVAMSVIHSIQQHADDSESRAMFHFRSVQRPMTAWAGRGILRPPASQPRISQADFSSSESFAHDFSRWCAWVSARTITLARVSDFDEPRMAAHALPLNRQQLAGRPVQHQDGGVSVLVLGAGDTGTFALHRLRFDAEGSQTSDTILAKKIPVRPDPLASGCDRSGRLWVISAAAGSFPVTLHMCDGTELKNVEEYAPADAPERVLAVRIARATRYRGPLGVFLAAQPGGESARVTAGMTELAAEPAGAAQWRYRHIPVGEWLAPGETIAAGDLLPDAGGDLQVVLATSGGRLMKASPGGELVTLAEGIPLVPDSLALVFTSGCLLAFFAASDRGLQFVPVG